MKKVKEMKHLHESGLQIMRFIDDKLPRIINEYSNPSTNTDKHNDGWIKNGDSLQSVNIPLSYVSFTGSYGSSSVYSDIDFDAALFSEYFIRYLNRNTVKIFHAIAEEMISQSIDMRNDALSEIEQLKNEIEDIV